MELCNIFSSSPMTLPEQIGFPLERCHSTGRMRLPITGPHIHNKIILAGTFQWLYFWPICITCRDNFTNGKNNQLIVVSFSDFIRFQSCIRCTKAGRGFWLQSDDPDHTVFMFQTNQLPQGISIVFQEIHSRSVQCHHADTCMLLTSNLPRYSMVTSVRPIIPSTPSKGSNAHKYSYTQSSSKQRNYGGKLYRM